MGNVGLGGHDVTRASMRRGKPKRVIVTGRKWFHKKIGERYMHRRGGTVKNDAVGNSYYVLNPGV